LEFHTNADLKVSILLRKSSLLLDTKSQIPILIVDSKMLEMELVHLSILLLYEIRFASYDGKIKVRLLAVGINYI